MTQTPRRRLYLIADVAAVETPERLARFMEALEAGDAACVRLMANGASREAMERAVLALKPACDRADAALLLQDAPRMARALRLDGVHLTDPGAYASARETLGRDAVIGVGCGDSRHQALVVAERGADYVSFVGADVEMLAWWQEMIEAPCVTEAPDDADESMLAMLARPADFLALPLSIFNDDHNAADTVARAQAIVDAMAD